MSSRSSRSAVSKQKGAAKALQCKDEDWTTIKDPSERRRIQNRIAQRKFREKAREQRELLEREAQDQQLAAGSYEVARPEAIAVEEGLPGLPWGGVDLSYIVTRGHQYANWQATQRTSASDHQANQPLLSPCEDHFGTISSLDGHDSSAEQVYHQDTSGYGCYFDGYTGNYMQDL